MADGQDNDGGRLTFAKDLVAGQLAGMGQVVSGHWLDTLKVRMQTAPAGQYAGTLDCARQVVRAEGVSALFRGMLSPMLGIGAQSAVLFAAFGQVVDMLQAPPPPGAPQRRVKRSTAEQAARLSVAELGVAGACAGVAGSFIMGPLELVKTQLQVSARDGMGTLRFGVALVRAHGLTCLGRGLGSTVAREIPANMAFFAVYTSVKRQLTPPGVLPTEVGAGVMVPAAVCAGMSYWLACFPIDLVKSRIQAVPMSERVPAVSQIVRSIWSTRGPAGFYAGLTPCLLRAWPAASSMFVLYEMATRGLDKYVK